MVELCRAGRSLAGHRQPDNTARLWDLKSKSRAFRQLNRFRQWIRECTAPRAVSRILRPLNPENASTEVVAATVTVLSYWTSHTCFELPLDSATVSRMAGY